MNNFARTKTETKELKLKESIAVELRYETITVEDGSLHIYRDVYAQNTNTEESLRAVLEAYGVKLEDLTADERTQVLEALAKMSGTPTSSTTTPSPNSSISKASPAMSKEEKGTRAAAKPAKQTRPTQNQNEIVITIAALKGKGYPAPVGM